MRLADGKEKKVGVHRITAFLFVFFSTFLIHFLTLSRFVPIGDSGELATAAYCLGIPHPPGYPLYSMLCKLAVLLSGSEPVFNANLLSALFASLSAGMLFILIGQLTSSYIIGILAALVFATTREFWCQSVVAEVYTLHILILCMLIILLIQAANRKSGWIKMVYLIAFIFGLGLGNHHTLLSFLVLLPFMLRRRFIFILRHPRSLVTTFLFFLLGISVYLYLPLRSCANPPLDWGNPQGLSGFVETITRTQYRAFEIIRSWDIYKEQLLFSLKEMVSQFGAGMIPGILAWCLVILGFGILLKQDKMTAIGIFIFILANTLWVILISDLSYSHFTKLVPVFFIPAYLAAIILISIAISSLVGSFRIIGCIFLCLVLFNQTRLNYSIADHSKKDITNITTTNILHLLPNNAVLLTEWDDIHFPLLYAQVVKGKRPDLKIINRLNLAYPWGYANVEARYPDLTLVPIEKIVRQVKTSDVILVSSELYRQFIFRNQGRFRIFATVNNFEKIVELFAGDRKAIPYTLVLEIVPYSMEYEPNQISPLLLEAYNSIRFGSIAKPSYHVDDRTHQLINCYALGLMFMGSYMREIDKLIPSEMIIKKAIQLDPIDPQPYYHLGLTYLAMGRNEKAAQAWEKCLELDNTVSMVRKKLIELYRKEGNQEAAAQHEKLLQDTSYPGETPTERKGRIAFTHGNYREAANAFRRAIKQNPERVDNFYNLGASLIKLGELQEASRWLIRCLALDPDHQEAMRYLAKIYIELKDYSRAEAVLKKFTSRSPDDAAAWKDLSMVLMQQEKFQDAIEANRRLVKLMPNDARGYYNLGVLYYRLGQVDNAIGYWKQATSKQGVIPDIYYNLAVVSAKKGELKDAHRYIEKALSLKAGFEPALKLKQRLQ